MIALDAGVAAAICLAIAGFVILRITKSVSKVDQLKPLQRREAEYRRTLDEITEIVLGDRGMNTTADAVQLRLAQHHERMKQL